MDGELSLNWETVLAWRAERSFLASAARTAPGVIAERLCGVQAQVMSSAELALSARSTSVKPASIRSALWQHRTLVKTWTVRGTLHLVTPDDYWIFAAAMQARGEYWATPSWEKYHGITAKEMRLVLDKMDVALGDKCLTRNELAERLGKATKLPGVAAGIMGSWGSAIKPSAFHAKLCFGPSNGRNVTFVSPRHWLGDFRIIDIDDALATLARRYFDTYGPATKEDLTRWLGVEAKVGRRSYELIKDELMAVDVAGSVAYVTSAGAKSIAKIKTPERVRLLPAFDPYIVGVLNHLDRLLPDASLRGRVSRTAGWISPTIVCDGRVLGVWKHERKNKSIDVTLDFFAKPSRDIKQKATAEMDVMKSLLDKTEETEDVRVDA